MVDDKIKALPARPVFDGPRPDYVPSKPVRRLESEPIKPKLSWADLIQGKTEEEPMQQMPVQPTAISAESPVLVPVSDRPWPPKVTLPKVGTESYRVVSYLYRHGETSYAELIRQVGSIHARFRENIRKLVMQGRIENRREGSTVPEGVFALSADCLALFQNLAPKASDQQSAEEKPLLSESSSTPSPTLALLDQSEVQNTPAASVPGAVSSPTEAPAAKAESVPAEDDMETRITETIADLDTLLHKLSSRAHRAEKFVSKLEILLAEYSAEG